MLRGNRSASCIQPSSDNNGFDTGLKDGDYTVTLNLWWGDNGRCCRLYENGQLVDTQALTAGTPNAQSAETSLNGRVSGEYEYEAVLVNAAGETKSEKMKITVK